MKSFKHTAAGRSLWGDFCCFSHTSGASVVYLDDGRTEQGFALGFPAAVPDDSGVAHVLEHMIFRGARGCDDDQLYTGLKSGSLASHLNASTEALMTSYHLASPVPVDAQRLQAALLEAVFHPLLRPEAFGQEAFDPQTRRAGVVMNEMIGHLARPEAALEQALRRALFQGHPLGHCYGGDPKALERLSLAELKSFHSRYYHPQDALVLLTGAGDIAPRLSLLARAFAEMPTKQVSSRLDRRAPLTAASGEVAGLSGMAWGLPENLDAWHRAVLARIVEGHLGGGALLPRSGLVDGPQPYLALLSRQPLQVDLEALAASLTPARLAEAAESLLACCTDPELDFRLPAGLQIWPALCAAHLRGEPPATALSDPPAYDLDCLRAALRQMSTLRQAPLDRLGPNGAVPSTAPAKRVAVLSKRPFVPLELRHLPELAPTPAVFLEQGIFCLDRPEGSYLRLCLWFAGGHLPEAMRRQLPDLAASAQSQLQVRASYHHVDQVGLLLEARLSPAALPAWLARLDAWLAAPAVTATLPQSLPWRIECRLRATFSTAWAAVADLECAQAPSDLAGVARALRPHLSIACSDPRASAILALWRGTPAPKPAAQTVPMAPRDALLAAEEGLFSLGLGLDLQTPPHLTELALRAIETEYLWPVLRVSGGAYGLRTTRSHGLVTMISLRDPQGPASLQLMQQAGGWLATHADAALLHRAQLAAAAQVLRPKPVSQLLREAAVGAKPEALSVADLRAADLPQIRLMGEAFAAAPTARVVLAKAPALAAFDLKPDR